MAGHSVDEYLETIYFLAFPIGEYRPDPNSSTAIASRVAEMLGVSRASAGEMLKRLEAEGLVERGEQKEAILTDDRDRAGRARRPEAPHHRAPAHRLHGLHGRRGARARRRARRHVLRGHGRADRGAARQPRALPARLARRPRVRAGREQGAGPAHRPEGRAAGGDRPARRARRRASALVLRRGLHPGNAGRDPRGPARRSPVQGAAGRQGRAGDRREGRRRPLRSPPQRPSSRASPPGGLRSGARSPRS